MRSSSNVGAIVDLELRFWCWVAGGLQHAGMHRAPLELPQLPWFGLTGEERSLLYCDKGNNTVVSWLVFSL